MKRQKKAKKLIKKATVRNSISYTVFFINRTVTDGPTALDCLKQMTKVIKSYGGSSLPTCHKRPLIYNLSGCVWLKAAGIPLRLAVLKVSICTLQRLTISVGKSRNIWQFDPFKRCPNEKIFCTSFNVSGNVQELDEVSHLWFLLCGGHVEIQHSEHLHIPVRVLKKPLKISLVSSAWSWGPSSMFIN